MHQTLEGRIAIEKSENGIHVAIPMRRGPFTVIYGPLIAIWLIVATVRYWNLLAGPHPEDTNFDLQQIAIGIYVVGFLYFICWLAWTMTGKTVVTLNPPEVKIDTCVFGLALISRTFHTKEIHRIRFIPHRRLIMQRSVLNSNSSRIRFGANNGSESLAKGVTKDEARALIDKMLQMYEFPRSWF